MSGSRTSGLAPSGVDGARRLSVAFPTRANVSGSAGIVPPHHAAIVGGIGCPLVVPVARTVLRRWTASAIVVASLGVPRRALALAPTSRSGRDPDPFSSGPDLTNVIAVLESDLVVPGTHGAALLVEDELQRSDVTHASSIRQRRRSMPARRCCLHRQSSGRGIVLSHARPPSSVLTTPCGSIISNVTLVRAIAARETRRSRLDSVGRDY